MTDKARKIMKKMKNWKRLNNPETRERFLSDFNQSTLDDVGTVGGDQEIKDLKELNEMADLERDAGKENPDR
jgi:hypothetical protein